MNMFHGVSDICVMHERVVNVNPLKRIDKNTIFLITLKFFKQIRLTHKNLSLCIITVTKPLTCVNFMQELSHACILITVTL